MKSAKLVRSILETLELLQLDKKFRIQKERQLGSEIGNLHNLVRIREESVNAEKSKELVVLNSLSEHEKKVRELTSIVKELTSKNKNYEATIHLLEVTSKEIELTHANEIKHFEDTIRLLNQQMQEQQTYGHTMKTENNSMKILINQLTQTVEGQKAAYENLRNQLAEVYKQKQEQSNVQASSHPYVPKVTVNMTARESSYSRKDTLGLQGSLNADLTSNNSRWVSS